MIPCARFIRTPLSKARSAVHSSAPSSLSLDISEYKYGREIRGIGTYFYDAPSI
jgi:hypothetical protein